MHRAALRRDSCESFHERCQITSARSSTNETRGLLRSVTRIQLTAITINAVVGAGIFGLPSRAYALAGDYSLAGFVVCAVFAGLIALCFAEVASRFTETGGPYVYVRRCFGEIAGFEVGWLMWLARVAAFAANSNLMISYIGQFWPDASAGSGRVISLSVVSAVMFVLNVTGIQNTARANNIFTVGKLTPLVIFIVAGLFAVRWDVFSPAHPPAPDAFLAAVLVLVYAFTGFEMTSVTAGEVRDPRRDLPFALLTAVAAITVLYTLVQVVCIGTLPTLASSERPLADAAQTFLGRPGVWLIVAGVIVSILGNLNITLLAGSRLLFAMAEGASLPAPVAALSARFRTPWVAISFTVLPMWIIGVSGTFAYAAMVSAIARLVVFISTAAAMIYLRRQSSAPEPRFVVRYGSAAAIACIAISVLLLAAASAREGLSALAAAAVGLLVFSINRFRRNRRTRTAK